MPLPLYTSPGHVLCSPSMGASVSSQTRAKAAVPWPLLPHRHCTGLHLASLHDVGTSTQGPSTRAARISHLANVRHDDPAERDVYPRGDQLWRPRPEQPLRDARAGARPHLPEQLRAGCAAQANTRDGRVGACSGNGASWSSACPDDRAHYVATTGYGTITPHTFPCSHACDARELTAACCTLHAWPACKAVSLGTGSPIGTGAADLQ